MHRTGSRVRTNENNMNYKRFRHFGKDKVFMDFAFFAIAFNIKKMCAKMGPQDPADCHSEHRLCTGDQNHRPYPQPVRYHFNVDCNLRRRGRGPSRHPQRPARHAD